MSSNENVNVSITASIQGLLDGLVNATGAVKKSTDEMGEHFEGLGKTIENLKAPFLAITGLLAGGAMFKEVIGETVKWSIEVRDLAKVMGTTTEQASVLALALEHIGLSTDMYQHAVGVLSRQLATGSKAFENLGIETKNSDGTLRSAGEIMNDTLDRLREFTVGVDQNAAGVSVFGRQWAEVAPILRLTAENMAEAEEHGRRLHLIVGPDGVAQAMAYKLMMADISEVFKSVKVQVGNELLPLFTQLGSYLAEGGTHAAEVFGAAIKGVVTAFLVLKSSIDTIIQAVIGLVMHMVESVMLMGKVLKDLLAGEFKQALQDARDGGRQIRDDWVNAASNIKDSWTSTAEKIKQLWTGGAPIKKSAEPEQGDSFQAPETDNSDKLLKQRLQAEIEANTKLQALREHWMNQRIEITKRGEKIEDELLTERRRKVTVFVEQIGSALAGTMRSILDGTKSVSQALLDLVKGLADALVNSLIKVAEQMVITAISGKAANKGEAIGTTQGRIAEAAAGAYASQAFIPIVGPALGAAAAAETTATLEALTAPMLSAAQGFDIPSGVNPIVQTHQREMILPEEHADTIRGLKDGGGGSIVINAMDAASFDDFLRKHEQVVVKRLKRLQRDRRI